MKTKSFDERMIECANFWRNIGFVYHKPDMKTKSFDERMIECANFWRNISFVYHKPDNLDYQN